MPQNTLYLYLNNISFTPADKWLLQSLNTPWASPCLQLSCRQISGHSACRVLLFPGPRTYTYVPHPVHIMTWDWNWTIDIVELRRIKCKCICLHAINEVAFTQAAAECAWTRSVEHGAHLRQYRPPRYHRISQWAIPVLHTGRVLTHIQGPSSRINSHYNIIALAFSSSPQSVFARRTPYRVPLNVS